MNEDAHIFGTVSQLEFSISRVLPHLFSPSTLVYNPIRQEDCTGGKQGWLVYKHTLLNERQFNQVSSQVPLLVISICHLRKSLQKSVGRGCGNAELKSCED